MTVRACPESVERACPESDERAWEISAYREGDKEGVLALIRDEYGDTDLADGAYFDWLRAACPPDVGQWLVREKGTGRVISAATTVAAQAVWRGQGIKALLGFNIVVAPEYRRQGIHTARDRSRAGTTSTGASSKRTDLVVRKCGDCFQKVIQRVGEIGEEAAQFCCRLFQRHVGGGHCIFHLFACAFLVRMELIAV